MSEGMEKKLFQEVEKVIAEVEEVVVGKSEAVHKVMAAILAGGHILIDDIPGVGKTTLAMAFSRAMNLASKRVQFTPDVMPSDILGFSMYQKQDNQFVYQPGAVMCNLFLGDEINRTSPKTQSALLEVMEEGHVTVDGVTHEVPQPFIIIATENPTGSIGTQMLPESELDRFMICITIGYPELEDEIAIAMGKSSSNPLDAIKPVIDGEELLTIRKAVEKVFLHPTIYRYLCKLVRATRQNPYIELGVSTRGTIALVRMAKAAAFLEKRMYVTPEDVAGVFEDVAAHRIILNGKARINNMTAADVLKAIVEQEKMPSAKRIDK